MNTPDPAPVLELIDAFRRSKAMFTAVTLGVFEALHEHAETAAQLSSRLGTNAGALERLLDTCAGLGLLRREADHYVNTPLADTYLCDANAHSMTGYIRYSDEALFPMWAHLADAVR